MTRTNGMLRIVSLLRLVLTHAASPPPFEQTGTAQGGLLRRLGWLAGPTDPDTTMTTSHCLSVCLFLLSSLLMLRGRFADFVSSARLSPVLVILSSVIIADVH